MSEPSDQDLYAAACRGERASFERLAERHHGFSMRIAVGVMGERAAAEDVAHKAWLNVCRHLKQVEDKEKDPLELRHDASFLAWLRRVIVNVANDEFRRRRREFVDPLDQRDVPSDEDVALRVEVEDQRSALWRALQRLGERCRELLVLFLQDPPLSYESIAEVLGIPIGSIGPTRARCLDQLRAQL